MKNPTAILLVSCPDACGIVAALGDFLCRHNGNIVEVDQHVDAEDGQFFARLAWETEGFAIPADEFAAAFAPVAAQFNMHWRLHSSEKKMRMGLMFSKQAHCLHDVLARYESGEWAVEIPLALSNHDTLRSVVDRQGIPFEQVPIPKEEAGRAAAFARQVALLQAANCDFVVMARYMQILPPAFIQAFPMRIINIHHSFLPAFAGAKPYHAAHERGVKIIGATAHYATENLDEGPIIAQDVTRITHREGVDDLIRLGRDLEKVVLARAVYLHLNHRILTYHNRTVVFD